MLGRLLESRAIRDPAWARWGAGDDATLTGRRTVTEDSAMGLLAVHTAVKIISDAISTLPVDVYRGSGRLRTEVPNPPAWVQRPNTDLSRMEFVSQQVVSLLLRGNAYSLIVRNPLGAVLELWPLHPDWVRVTRADFSRTTIREYTINGVPVPADRMLHITGMMSPGALVGVDPITAARDALALGVDAQTYGAKFFSQSAIPAGVIRMPGDNLTVEQAKDLRDQWRGMHGGPNRSNLPAVLTGGAEYQPITITNEQSQFLETRQYTDSQIYKLFGLMHPYGPATGPTVTYANVEQTARDLATYALLPLTTKIEYALTNLLPRPQYWKFNFDAFLRADTKSRYDAYRVANPAAVFLTEDEIRELEDRPPLPTDPTPSGQPVDAVPDPTGAM